MIVGDSQGGSEFANYRSIMRCLIGSLGSFLALRTPYCDDQNDYNINLAVFMVSIFFALTPSYKSCKVKLKI